MPRSSGNSRPRFAQLFVAAHAAALLTIASTEAAADTITFAPPGTTVNGDDLRFGAPGLTVTASAYESTILDPQDMWFGESKRVTVSSNGLGVDGQGASESPYQIDGVGINEFLRLEFSTTVRLASFTLRNIDLNGTDGVRLYVGNDTTPALTRTGLSSNPTIITLTTPLIGSRFTFTLAGGNGLLDPNAKSDYSLSAVDVEVHSGVPAAEMPVVPVPAAALGGAALFASLIGWRRIRYLFRSEAV